MKVFSIPVLDKGVPRVIHVRAPAKYADPKDFSVKGAFNVLFELYPDVIGVGVPVEVKAAELEESV